MKKTFFVMAFVVLFITGCAGNIKEGVSLLEAKQYEEAKAVFEKDIQKERNLNEAYRGAGIACFEMKEYEQATQYLTLALEHEGEQTPTIYAMLGASYIEMEEYDKALDAYESALAQENITESQKQEIQYNLIAVYEYMGNWDAAKTQMENYVKAYPDDTRVEKEAEFLETR